MKPRTYKILSFIVGSIIVSVILAFLYFGCYGLGLAMTNWFPALLIIPTAPKLIYVCIGFGTMFAVMGSVVIAKFLFNLSCYWGSITIRTFFPNIFFKKRKKQ